MLKIKEDILNYIKKMKDLYNILLSYLDNCTEDEEDFFLLFDFIENQKIKENKDELIEFFLIVVNICNNHHRNKFFLQKIEKIISSFFDIFKQNFIEPEIFHIFETNKRILFFLVQNKIITLTNKEMKIGNVTYRIYLNDQYLDLKDENKIKIGENDWHLCELIRNDLIDDFIIYTTQFNIPLDNRIKSSKYETNPFLIDKSPTFIEYAAFFGSIQIFQYLRMNKIEITPSVLVYAIHSNSPEIINLIEESKIDLDDDTYLICFKESIKCHHNDIANYIKENHLKVEFEKFDNSQYCMNIDTLGFEYHNYEYIPQVVSFTFIVYACQFNHLKLVKLLLKMRQLKPSYGLYLSHKFLTKNEQLFDNSWLYHMKDEVVTPLRVAAFYQNFNIFNTLMSLKGFDIARNCFQSWMSLVKISIPSSIKQISSKAFFCCTYLREVTFESPSSLTKIDSDAFSCCSSLQEISIPSSVSFIGPYAFYGCQSLKHITIPSSIEIICSGTFGMCSSLEIVSFEMPISVEIIGVKCFQQCTSLTRMWIPYSVKEIGLCAFNGCTSLKISIPNSLNSIGCQAFEGCLSCDRY